MISFMIRKLYSLASGEIGPDNADSPMNFELLLPGHVYLMFLKEKMQEWLVAVKLILNKLHAMPSAKAGLTWESDPGMPAYPLLVVVVPTLNRGWRACRGVPAQGHGEELRPGQEGGLLPRHRQPGLVHRHGPHAGTERNLVHLTRSALRLTHTYSTLRPSALQLNGYVVVAEKLNWLRYFSHFRCVHRGAFFATMKTTAVRKLMPESWGALTQLPTLFTALLHTAIINRFVLLTNLLVCVVWHRFLLSCAHSRRSALWSHQPFDRRVQGKSSISRLSAVMLFFY